MPTIFVPAQPYPKQANDNIRSSDWNAAINEVSRLSDATQYLNRNTFNGPLTVSGALTASAGINGPLTVKGDLTIQGVPTVAGSFMSIAETTVLATNTTGPWASFGSNAYYGGNGWRLAKTGQAGVCLVMNGQGVASRQFAFCRMEANSTTATDIATIGAGGLTVNGDETVSGKLTVNGTTTTSEFKGPVTVSGLLTASNGLTVNGALLTANRGLTVNNVVLTAAAGLTVTGNQTVSGTLTASGLLTASAGLTVNNVVLTANKGLTVTGNQTVSGTLTVSGLLTASNGLTVTGALTANGGITGPVTVNGKLTVGSSSGILQVGSVTTISQNSAGSWAGIGNNLYTDANGAWILNNTSKPGVNFHMGADGTHDNEFRFARRETNGTQVHLATIGTGGLTIPGGIRGSDGQLTVHDSFLSLSQTTVLSTNADNGPWASFGSNAYYRGNGWKLANATQAGVCLRMSAVGGGNSEFRFARVAANSTTGTDLATIGTEGLTVSGKLTVNGTTTTSELKGPVTVSGLLTASAGLTVTGNQTVSNELTVNGLLKANFGINAPLTIKGAVDNALTIEGSLVKVRGVTTMGTDTHWSWSSFGCNLWAKNNGWELVTPSQPGVCLYMGTASAANKEFRFVRTDANLANRQELASIGTGGLTVSGGINGPVTVNGALTVTGTLTASAALTVTGALTANGGINGPNDMLAVNGSFLSVEGRAVVSTSLSNGPWACFGSNAYYRGSGFHLTDTTQPGVCFYMSGGSNGGNSEFRFARVEANSTSGTNLVTMGREGIVVHSGKKVATAGEFLYIVRGQVEANGTPTIGEGFTVSKIATGIYQINFNPGFSNWPIVVATQRGPENSNTRDNALIVGIGYEWVKIKVGDDSGVARDRAFNFIAMGPRN